MRSTAGKPSDVYPTRRTVPAPLPLHGSRSQGRRSPCAAPAPAFCWGWFVLGATGIGVEPVLHLAASIDDVDDAAIRTHDIAPNLKKFQSITFGALQHTAVA